MHVLYTLGRQCLILPWMRHAPWQGWMPSKEWGTKCEVLYICQTSATGLISAIGACHCHPGLLYLMHEVIQPFCLELAH